MHLLCLNLDILCVSSFGFLHMWKEFGFGVFFVGESVRSFYCSSRCLWVTQRHHPQLFYFNSHTIDTYTKQWHPIVPLPLLINSAEPPAAQLDTAWKFKDNYEEKTHQMSIALTNVI